MFRDGNIDQWDVNRAFSVRWRMHHAYTLSKNGCHCQCPFTEPFDGFKSIFGQSSGFTTDSPAPESTVISRCRPRSPSVATGLLSMDMFPIVTAFKSTSSAPHSPSLELSLGLLLHWRCHTVALSLADVGTLPASGTLNRQGS